MTYKCSKCGGELSADLTKECEACVPRSIWVYPDNPAVPLRLVAMAASLIPQEAELGSVTDEDIERLREREVVPKAVRMGLSHDFFRFPSWT